MHSEPLNRAQAKQPEQIHLVLLAILQLFQMKLLETVMIIQFRNHETPDFVRKPVKDHRRNRSRFGLRGEPMETGLV